MPSGGGSVLLHFGTVADFLLRSPVVRLQTKEMFNLTSLIRQIVRSDVWLLLRCFSSVLAFTIFVRA